MPGTVKSNKLIKKYLELFEVRYEERQEVVVLGAFNTNTNLINQTKQLDVATVLVTVLALVLKSQRNQLIMVGIRNRKQTQKTYRLCLQK